MAFGITALILFATVSASANVTLPALLADHMVVQRGLPVRVWGMAAPHESVAVTFRGETKSATADDLGRWSVSLSPGEALRLALAARAIAYGEKIEWSGHHISPGHASGTRSASVVRPRQRTLRERRGSPNSRGFCDC
jgi:hypothetical protein